MKRIFIAGHRGLVGSAVLRRLTTDPQYSMAQQFGRLEIITRTRTELDLTRQEAVEEFYREENPDITVFCSARVGGIIANNFYTAEFIRENLQIQTNVIEAARLYGCEKFCFLGSSCIYPRLCPQPIKEEYLLSGTLEETNKSYSIAKIAGIQMIDAYRKQYGFNGYSLMPTNLFGQFDNFNLETSHAIPAIMRKIHNAKINNQDFATLLGTGTAFREFLYVDDLASIICSTLFRDDIPTLMNVGSGMEIKIKDLAEMIKAVVGFDGEIKYDASKLDGTPKKLLDISKMNALGLKAETGLKEGLEKTYEWFLKNNSN